eukprot:2829008-Alexandrium_andersonii.AAC.1
MPKPPPFVDVLGLTGANSPDERTSVGGSLVGGLACTALATQRRRARHVVRSKQRSMEPRCDDVCPGPMPAKRRRQRTRGPRQPWQSKSLRTRHCGWVAGGTAGRACCGSGQHHLSLIHI